MIFSDIAKAIFRILYKQNICIYTNSNGNIRTNNINYSYLQTQHFLPFSLTFEDIFDKYCLIYNSAYCENFLYTC